MFRYLDIRTAAYAHWYFENSSEYSAEESANTKHANIAGGFRLCSAT